MSGAIAITGGPPDDDSFLRRLERAMRNGQLPDPRTGRGALLYALFGLALGFFIGVAW
jgi:hypothetical protein